MTTVAVLGTGIMGAPMARNLAKAGFEVSVWNRSEEKARPLADDGCDVAGSPADAVREADFVLTMLADGDAVASVMADAVDSVKDGAIWVQTSTVGDGIERLIEIAREHDVVFVDAPVLGTKQPAEQAQLIVLIGGPDDAKRRGKPVFDAVGAKTLDLGEAGTAMRTKLMLNHWVLGVVEATAETIAFGEAIGVDPSDYLEIISGGPLDSQYAQMKGKAILAREMPPAFPLSGALKDVRLVLEAAERHDHDLGVLPVVREQVRRAVAAGHGEDDLAALFAGV